MFPPLLGNPREYSTPSSHPDKDCEYKGEHPNVEPFLLVQSRVRSGKPCSRCLGPRIPLVGFGLKRRLPEWIAFLYEAGFRV